MTFGINRMLPHPPSSLYFVSCYLTYFRKELKDPDQLYSTLKTILQHVKVRDRHTHTEHL